MGKSAMLALGGGGLSAAAWLAVLFGSPGGFVLAYVAPLPLLLVGLAWGTNGAALAASVGLAMVALLSGFAAAGVYGGMHALPSWLVVHQALLRGPQPAGGGVGGAERLGTILASLGAIAAFVSVCTAVAAGGNDGIEATIHAMLVSVTAMAAPDLDEVGRDLLARSLTPVFVGFSAANWQVMIAVNAVTAQIFLEKRGWALRPSPCWSMVRLPDWLSLLLVTAAVVAIVSGGDTGYLARNAVIALATPFFFTGLALVHQIARRSRSRALWLIVFYAALVVFFAVVAAAVAGVGMISQWRRQAAPAGPGDVVRRE